MEKFIVLQRTLTIDALPEDRQRVFFYVPSENEVVVWHDEVEAGYYDARQEMFVVGDRKEIGYQWIRFAQDKVLSWLPYPEPLAFT